MTANSVTGKFVDFPVCVIQNIFFRKLPHLTISSPFILIKQKKCIKTTLAFEQIFVVTRFHHMHLLFGTLFLLITWFS